jgi:hypothetical protein
VIKKLVIYSVLTLNRQVPFFGTFVEGAGRYVYFVVKGINVWEIDSDGSPEGFREAFANAQENSFPMQNITHQVMELFVSADYSEVKDWVVKNSIWTTLSVIPHEYS